MPTSLEELIVNAIEPIATPHDVKERTVNGERGLWLNENDELQWKGGVNINEYAVNNDQNPQYKVKVISKPVRFLRSILVRRLKPPKPPQHGDLIISQEADIVKPAAPPIIIRKAGLASAQPETIVIREKPPKIPDVLPEQTIRVKGKLIEPPPRRVIIEKLPDEPVKPQNIIIEKWLPYEIQKRRVVFHKFEQTQLTQNPAKNLFIEWRHSNPVIEDDVKFENVLNMDPSQYLAKYGGSLKDFIDVQEYETNVHEYASHFRSNQKYNLEGDVFALDMLDNRTLEELGLNGYIKNNFIETIIPNIPRPELTPPTPSKPILTPTPTPSTPILKPTPTPTTVSEPAIMQTPTLRAAQSFDPKADCEKLHKAMKGFGTDEKTIIEILGNRSNDQRQVLKSTFKSDIKRDLISDLKSELSGNFDETIQSLMMTQTEYSAYSFMKAIKGLGTKEEVLVELLITHSSEQLAQIKQIYQEMFHKNLEKDIITDTSGNFQKYLVALLNTKRPNNNLVDKAQAQMDSQNLLNAGVKRWANDEKTFIEIFCSKSFSQTRAILHEYKVQSGHSIDEDIKKELSGDLLKCFKIILECIADQQQYFANVLYKSMKGLGTNDFDLIRVVVSRCEIDMVQIKQKFSVTYKETLANYIKDDTSGDYEKILIKLIGES